MMGKDNTKDGTISELITTNIGRKLFHESR